MLFIAPHPDDDAIGCGAFLLYLSKFCKNKHAPTSIHIAYAVSGFGGVTDRFAAIVASDFEKRSESEKRLIKSEIRKKEATECCNYLHTNPVFWNLPFYEKQRKIPSAQDLEIIKQSICDIQPDLIFLIDETNDPHGTHGIVRQLSLQALQAISFPETILGYRVWEPNYPDCQCYIALFFDEAVMAEKTKLISFYKSQIQDPAFPHEHHSFIDLVKHSNRQMSHGCNAELTYMECYKILLL